jgi:Protein of unknown function with HXXEE motif
MQWYRANWYWVGGLVAAAAVIYLAAAWGSLDELQRLLLAGFALVPLHEFEEYGWPGGEPAIMNKVIQPSGRPDRYPLNQNSAMIVNVSWYPFALLALIFQHQIWLGLGTLLFWVGQFVIHGIVTNVKLKTIYNPGTLTMLLGLALLVYYVYYLESKDLASLWDWVGGVAVMAAFAGIFLLKMTYSWLADQDSPYHFTEAEIGRWDVDAKLARISASSSTPTRE